MKIAQIAPLMERVPPKLYGSTERIVCYLTDALVAQGHDVTLFASSDSITAAQLAPCTAQALRLNPAVRDPIPHYMVMLDKVRSMADEFDILHFHIDQFHFPIFRDQASRSLTTLHGRQDLPDLRHLYEGFPEMPLVSVSEAQRRPITDASVVATVPHGIPRDLLAPALIARGGYLALLGRISPEKRVDRAIAIARAVGLPLKIAAKVDRVDEAYFRSKVAPLLDQSGVEFIGEIDERQKSGFLGGARALLFPIDWPEPFGLVMIEAMARGTPVLAFRHGSVPEVVEDGITGYVVESVEEAICKLGRLLALDRGRVRRRFEQRFTADRMAQDYLKVYARLVDTRVGRDDRRRRRVPASRSTVASLPPETSSQVAAFTPTATSHQRPSLIAPQRMVEMTVQALIAGKGRAVPTIKSDTTLQDVIERLERANAGALVVTDDNERILGIITERDIARGLKTFGRNVVDKPVRELMTTNVIVCDIEEPLSRVLELMDRYQIHYVPITCAGVLCGIITMLDLAKYRLAEIEAEAKALRSYISGG